MAEEITNTTPEAPNYDEIFNKLDMILDKRSDGLAKSALKDNGVDENEIADIVKAYREQKQIKATEQQQALDTANQTIADLQRQLAERDINEAFASAALDLGIDTSVLPYISRLADRTDVLNNENKPDPEKVKAAIGKVLDDIPALKSAANENIGFVPVGTKDGNGAETPGEPDAKLRKAFGLK